MEVKTALIIIAVTNFIDALTTFILVANGGREVNRLIADVVNSNPYTIFIIHAVVTAAVAALLFTADSISRLLPGQTRSAVWKFFDRGFAASLCVKSVILVNNILGVVAGVTPIANLFIDM